MMDFKRQIEKLEAEAAECELIARLAVDKPKREAFEWLASRYRALAHDMTQELRKFSKERGHAALAEELHGHEIMSLDVPGPRRR
ncbi:hypothetical protein X566_18995 [Afipia sp. P52-10]|jgi:hypothetical protein|uniref:hypothetical protein n=1 Tax=Afipia sp. P52-10 TaxID=1429916 RepID=UPI0003DF0949|nr:hypothetical protein [Afipia sp. P52-10]ETR74897.1 hypothetical protein X566_18995 [Afipia sp. P52-10]